MTSPLVAPNQAVIEALDWQLMRDQLDWLNRLAMDDLLKLIRAAQMLDNAEDSRQYIMQGLHDLVLTYGGSAEDMTVEWLTMMMDDPSSFVVPPRKDAYVQLTKQVRWGTAPMVTGKGDMTQRLAGILQRHIFGAQRDTVDIMARQRKIGYQRIARADACAFCRVLAGRGAVYGSVARAQYVGMGGVQKHYSNGKERGERFTKGRVRGLRKAGQTYHDHCRCITAPLIPGKKLEYPDYQDKFDEEYQRAALKVQREGKTLSMQDVTRIMREQQPGVR